MRRGSMIAFVSGASRQVRITFKQTVTQTLVFALKLPSIPAYPLVLGWAFTVGGWAFTVSLDIMVQEGFPDDAEFSKGD